MTKNGLKRAASLGVKRLPGGSRLVRRAVLSRHVPAVLRSGLFDQGYYQLQSGMHFDSRRSAVLDYLLRGRRLGLAPNPLLEAEWFMGAKEWRRHREPVIIWLRDWKRAKACGPLFDATRYLAVHPEAKEHPGGPLGHFLANATDDDVMPVARSHRGAPPTWGKVRAAAAERAAAYGAVYGVDGPATAARKQPEWDLDADAAFVARWSQAPLPAADGDGPLVTVVMPVRNRPGLVRQAIASVQAQTLQAWELIVVDDGSTDDTADVVEAIAQADPRVRLLRREHGGVCAARNAALAQARGSWVAFLDSDNHWLPEFLWVSLAWAGSEDVEVAYSVVDSGDDMEERYLALDAGLEHLAIKNHIDLNTLVVRRALIEEVGGFDESLRRWVDHDLVLRLARISRPRLAPFVGVRYDAREDAFDRITLTESDHWQWVVLAKHYLDWSQVEAELPQRVPGRVSIAMPTYQDWELTDRAIAAVLANSGDHDIEIVVLDNGSRRSVSSILGARYLAEPRVRLVTMPLNLNFSTGSNLGFAHATGETVVFLNNDTEVCPGWLDPLLKALEDPDVLGAQPLLLYPDGSIQSAGTVFTDVAQLPTPFLVNMPPEDAERAAPIRLRVATAAALAMRARDVVALRGFDPIFVNGMEDVDLCLRALKASGGTGRFAIDPASRVMHHESKTPGRGLRIQANRALLLSRWADDLPPSDSGAYEALGLHVAHLDQGPGLNEPGEIRIPRPVIVRPPRTVTVGDEPLPSLRWAIKIAANAGPRGDGWGDTHFAAALRRCLEALGQEVVVDRLQSHERKTCYLDDVVLTLRGLENVTPQPGRVNLLWVISHPEQVTPEEVRRYDAAFAASTTWAARMSELAGVEVEPLLQATDPRLFHPDALAETAGHQALFVGNSRKVYRPVVRDAIEAGLDLAVYGGGWEGTPAQKYVAGTYLPNEELSAWYARARVVLNDHWADMAAEGFVSNRLFDAVASGARVVSDPVEGLEELFGRSVQVYRTPADLARLAAGDDDALDAVFGDAQARREQAKRVAEDHSFDARARRLLQVALAARGRHRLRLG